MIAYKLFKIRKDGSIGSLFINASEKYEINKWMDAKPIKKNGFAFRCGFHCLINPVAPHLKMNLANGEKRAFFKVEIESYEYFTRPKSQGGGWVLAQRMKILEKL
jgi:hypothetical protein